MTQNPPGNYPQQPMPQPQGQPYPQAQQGQPYPQAPQGQPYPQAPGYGQPGPGQQGPGYAQAYAAEPAKKSKKAPALIAGGVALALVAGGSVFAFNYFNGGATPQAAKALPNDALMVIEVNLAPDLSQQQAVAEWAKRIPNSDDAMKTDNYKEGLVNLLDDLQGDSDALSWSELEPWLGDSAAMAIVPGEDEPVPVVAIHTKDKAKAEAYLDDSQEHVFIGDTMVFWEDYHKPKLDAQDVQNNPLAASEGYRNTMGKLSGELANFYLTDEVMLQALENSSYYYTEEQLDQFRDQVRDATLAGGLSATNDTLSLEFVTTQAQEITGGESVADFVGDLSADSKIAVGASYTEETLQLVWDSLGEEIADSYQMRELGIESFSDLKDLMGSSLALGVSGDFARSAPKVAAKVKGANHGKIEDLVDSFGASDVTVAQEGDASYVGFSVSEQELTSPERKLRDVPEFRKATEGASNPHALMWVNIAQLRDDLPEDSDEPALEFLKELSGAGLSVSSEGKTSKGVLRVIAEN